MKRSIGMVEDFQQGRRIKALLRKQGFQPRWIVVSFEFLIRAALILWALAWLWMAASVKLGK